MRFYDTVGGIQDLSKMLGSVLAGMGLDNEEISDITTDPAFQSLLTALSLPEKDALRLVEIMDDPQRLLYHSLVAMAQGLQTTAVQWILKNPDSFVNIVCGSAHLLNLFPPLTLNPYGLAAMKGVNAFCGIRGAQRSLPKLEAHLRKLHEAKPSGVVSSSRSTNVSTSTGQGFYVPPRAQSRINIIEGTGKVDKRPPHELKPGVESTWNKHMTPERTNKSQFTISREEVRSIIGDKKTILTPITRMGNDGTYVREVQVGKVIGKLPEKNGSKTTSIVTILTDAEGNLVNIFPGPLKYVLK